MERFGVFMMLVFWVPTLYLLFVSFWRAVRMCLVLFLWAGLTLFAGSLVPLVGNVLALGLVVAVFVWPVRMAFVEFRKRYEES